MKKRFITVKDLVECYNGIEDGSMSFSHIATKFNDLINNEVVALRKNVSQLQIENNNLRDKCTVQITSNTNRKRQITKWNYFFKKLLSENRITKEELNVYSTRKEKK